MRGLVLPVFRATAVSWAAAKYRAHETELAAVAAAARAAVNPPAATNDDAGIAVAYAATATLAAVDAAADFSAVDAATHAFAAVDAAAHAFAFADDALRDATADYSLGLATIHTEDAFWSAVSTDATRVEQGGTASVIASSPLWPQGQPDNLRSLWQEMKSLVHGAKQDWEVWTIRYDDRLEGRVQEEERELLYVRIDKDLWDQGPAIVNAEIKRILIEGHPRAAPEPPLSLPKPIENIRSAVCFGWTPKATITVVSGLENWPVFPFKGGEQDHKNRLEACRALASDTAQSLQSGKWNARPDYAETLDQYVAYLPVQPEEGNFLLADAEARIIRAMFAADVNILSSGLAAKLKVFLEQHIGLRAYYPATEDFYESVRSGHLETPLPIDAVEGFIQGVRDNTPTLFEPNVSQALEGVAQSIPRISPADAEVPKTDEAQPAPPPDPLGEVDPEKARRFTLGGTVNALWRAFSNGEKIAKNVEGWAKVAETLMPYVLPILTWLRSTH
jgi:hypothetical protein